VNSLRIGSLCTGYGGLDGAAQSVLGGSLAWVSDNDSGASRILAHRFPSVPNLGDLTTADWAAAEPVDVLTGGFPCQPVSDAGLRKGLNDERWLFDDICTAIGRMASRPGLLLFENVRGLLPANNGDAMARVIQGLAVLGYVGRYGLLRASDVGACHRRARVFIAARLAADAAGARLGWGQDAGTGSGNARPRSWCYEPERGHPAAPEDADGAARGERRLAAPGQAEGGRPRADAGGSGGAPAADTRGPRHREHSGESSAEEAGPFAGDELAGDRGLWPAGDWGPYELAIRRHERAFGRPAPVPTEPGRGGKPRLAPFFVEWMMGLPAGWVTDVPGMSRNDQLKALGNGVVPRQAAVAMRLLLDRAGIAAPAALSKTERAA
jgi:DNA (cytosine-5)-methyltransferase 1